jgi:hypothetical protein
VRQSRQTGQIILARYDHILAIRSFSKNAISISKIPTATSWNQNKKSSPLVTVFIHYKRTYVSLCRSLSLMPFECLQHRKNAGCSCTENKHGQNPIWVKCRSATQKSTLHLKRNLHAFCHLCTQMSM